MRSAGALSVLLCALGLPLGACDSAPAAPPPEEEADEEEADEQEPSEALHLEVPPELIHEARREAAGLYRLPRSLRAQTLAERRAEAGPSYAELRAHPDLHERERVSFTGRVGLVRSAGPRLWIMALHTRRDGERWADPLYVLATIPPLIDPDGGVVATIDGWVAGERRIGRHALPLIVAYYIETQGS